MKTQRVYIVRVWYEPCNGDAIWRASVTDVRTQERRYFKNPEELLEFLRVHSPSLPALR